MTASASTILLFLAATCSQNARDASDGVGYQGAISQPDAVNGMGSLVHSVSTTRPADRHSDEPLSLETTTAPASRALPSPFDSPPYPLSDFLGPTIGAPDTTPDWPLQKMLNDTPLGRLMKEGRNKTYGWFSPGFNWSTSKDSNSPAAYCLDPNKAVIDQIVVVTERALDTVQKDHFDWGYHVLALYGTDYRYMIAKGLWSNQLLKRNELYGFDIPEFDVRFYFPNIADGTTLKIGRWISTPDIEACPTPSNYLYTHSMMFSIDPYTYFGIMADFRLDKHWTIEAGILGANDVAPWDESFQPNGHLMVRWVSDDNKDSIWGGVNMIGYGKWKADHDDLQHVVATWTHKFNDNFHMLTEAYYMWQRDGNLGGTINFGPVKSFGGGGGPGWFQTGLTDSWGIVNNLEFKLSNKDYISIRNDMFRDDEGQRTGLRNTYTTHCVNWSHNFTDWLIVRPELRYERGWNLPAYDNGKESGQFMFCMDMIIRF